MVLIYLSGSLASLIQSIGVESVVERIPVIIEILLRSGYNLAVLMQPQARLGLY